jgi:STAM-binding protein
MNYHDPHPSNASHHYPRAGPSRRPATISELAERANIPWDESKGFKHHLKLAEKYRRDGKEYARSGDMENAFVELAKAATLVLERLPEHPDYNTKLNSAQRHNLGLVCPFYLKSNRWKKISQFIWLVLKI